MLRSIKIPQRLPRLLAFDVTGTGTAAIGEGDKHASLTDNGTGDYTLTFTQGFARAPIAVATVLTADCIAQIHTVSTSVIRINLFDATDGTTAKDGRFHLMVLGFDTADET